MSVKLEAADKELLKKAAEGMRLRVREYGSATSYGSIMVESGVATFPETYRETFNKLKVEYSKKVVMQVAKRKGWSGAWSKTKETPTVTLRRY